MLTFTESYMNVITPSPNNINWTTSACLFSFFLWPPYAKKMQFCAVRHSWFVVPKMSLLQNRIHFQNITFIRVLVYTYNLPSPVKYQAGDTEGNFSDKFTKKIQQNATVYQNFISYLCEAQHVSGDTLPIIRSLKLH